MGQRRNEKKSEITLKRVKTKMQHTPNLNYAAKAELGGEFIAINFYTENE